MAQEYRKEDLENRDKLFANRLRTRVLEEFYEDSLMPNAYIYLLSNGKRIHLTFDEN